MAWGHCVGGETRRVATGKVKNRTLKNRGAFREHAAVQVGTDEEDGDFFRDAGRAAHNLWWQERPEGRGTGDNLVPRENGES